MSDCKDDPTAADPELDELLDSALQDMTKKTEQKDISKEGEKSAAEAEAALPGVFSEDLIREAAAQFESNMAAILGSFSGIPEDQITQDQIAQTFTKMAEAAAQVMSPGGAAPAPPAAASPVASQPSDVTATIAQTLQSLNANADNLQSPFTDEDLANMFNNFTLDGQEGGGNMFLPFMQGMMQSLLSKEVLYPSLKELLDKYPAWINNNKDKVDVADMDRYRQQETLMSRVCSELESEAESDSEEVRRARFETVLTLMQQMQELGQPPLELVGDMGLPPGAFPASPAPASPPDQQCRLM